MNSYSKNSVKPISASSYVKVVFNLPLRKPLIYAVPEKYLDKIKEGIRVRVPLGIRTIEGFVVGICEEADPEIKVKSVEEILDPEPVMGSELLALTRWIAEYYQASWGEAIKTALPSGMDVKTRKVFSLTEAGRKALNSQKLGEYIEKILKSIQKKPEITSGQLRKQLKTGFSPYGLSKALENGWITEHQKINRNTVSFHYVKRVRMVSNLPDQNILEKLLARSPKQKRIFEAIREKEKTMAELSASIPSPSAALRQLVEKKLVQVEEFREARKAKPVSEQIGNDDELELTGEQKKAFHVLFKALEQPGYSTILLHGVTGSGKTELYLRSIQTVLDQGRQAIMMVPEISLTPQTVNLFRRRFGDQVAILHSGLSDSERYLEWKNIFDGQVSIAVGARSAVFAPFKNIGVIIIDEEHDGSYKQDAVPRYHARDTAIVRARNSGAAVILGSATPSLESRWNAETGKYSYLTLKERVPGRLLPMVKILDMCKERRVKKNFSLLSVDLKNAIRDRLRKKEQTFLFLNRRGIANYLHCKDCGFVLNCPRCSVSLTFHGREKRLRCHYCNFSATMPKTCLDCSAEVIRFQGFGTQKLEEEVKTIFPEARVSRMDSDTARKQADFEAVFKSMNEGEIDILLGTQMITKGHDFPNVTLVGVVYADISLNIPDFRSGERSFQLLTQVAGRAGRGKIPGSVIIQTYHPDHYVFQWVERHQYESFYKKELQVRKKLNYPPHFRLVGLEIQSEHESRCFNAAKKLSGMLSERISKTSAIEMLGPSRAAIYQVNHKFRWRVILRSREINCLQTILRQELDLEALQKASGGNVRITIDVDPVNLL